MGVVRRGDEMTRTKREQFSQHDSKRNEGDWGYGRDWNARHSGFEPARWIFGSTMTGKGTEGSEIRFGQMGDISGGGGENSMARG